MGVEITEQHLISGVLQQTERQSQGETTPEDININKGQSCPPEVSLNSQDFLRFIVREYVTLYWKLNDHEKFSLLFCFYLQY